MDTNLPVWRPHIAGCTIVDALVGIGFTPSRGEAKRAITAGLVRIDGNVISDGLHPIPSGAGEWRISFGKKKQGQLLAP